jgi:hypothetical protein
MAAVHTARAIVSPCTVRGCGTLTMGPFCLTHDDRRPQVIIRGRPYVAVHADRRPGEAAPTAQR